MKIFGTGATPFSPQGADIPEGDPQELKFVTDQFQNSIYGELFNFLASQEITPTATAGADLKQLKKAVLSAVLSGNIYDDSGTDNNKILTHQAGSAFSYKLINTLQNGVSLQFVNKVENTGAVQITVYDAENAANLSSLINIPVLKEDGTAHVSGELKAGDLVYCIYSSTPSPRFIAPSFWLPVSTKNELVKYFTSIPTTNVGGSIFVDGRGQMHWDSATSSYKKDKLSVVSGSLKFYFDWDYSLLRYLVRGHGVINITTANVFQTLNYGVTLETSPSPVIAIAPIFGTAASVRTFLHNTPTATSVSLAASQVGFYDVSIFGEAI